MGTTADKLNHLLGTKDGIKAALISKGQSVSDGTPFSEYADKIRAIKIGTDTSDATAAAGDILSGKTAYVKGTKVTGTIASKGATSLTASGATVTVPAGYYPSATSKSVSEATQATPTISIDKTTGKITGSATQSAGYVPAGTKSGTLQLTAQAAASITPGTASKTAVAADRYTTGAVTVAGDANLVAGNIKSGVSIFGVAGTVVEGIKTDDATATAGDILSGKTAYVKGTKVTGTIASKGAADLTASGATVTAPAGYYPSAASKSVATATQATPSISVDTAGKITASATQTAGYVTDGTKSATQQLTTQAAKTVTPTTSEQTAVASGVYTTGVVKVAAMPTATQATPSLSINKTTGVVTGSATQTAGYVSAGTKSGTLSLSTQAATTITPGTSSKTAVAANKYTTGAVTVQGSSNLVAGNIKKGVSIFGVTGTLVEGVDTSDADATAGDIVNGKTAYVNDEKVTGSILLYSSNMAFSEGSISDYDATTFAAVRVSPKRYCIDAGCTLKIKVYKTDFGDATVSDVLCGKTFTSAEGISLTGIAPIPSPFYDVFITNLTDNVRTVIYWSSDGVKSVRLMSSNSATVSTNGLIAICAGPAYLPTVSESKPIGELNCRTLIYTIANANYNITD